MSSRRKYFTGTVLGLLLLGAGLWYAAPIFTFGGRYRHPATGGVYEFANGRFYVNGNDFGVYSVMGRQVDIYLEYANEDVQATIGWQTVTMPLPKSGQAEVLVR